MTSCTWSNNFLYIATVKLDHNAASYKEIQYDRNSFNFTCSEHILKRLHNMLVLVKRALISL